MIGRRNLAPELQRALMDAGIIGAADIKYVVKDGNTSKSYWDGITKGIGMYYSPSTGNSTAITNALAACSTGQNDVVMVSPDSHTLAASLAWNKNLTHLVGMGSGGLMNMRARIGHGSNLVNQLLNITGYGCIFAGLYTMYGNNDDTDVDKIAWQITGNRNSFINCHNGGPLGVNEADQADFNLINIAETTAGDGLEHYFKKCVIGVETTAWSAGSMIKISGTPRLVFDDCILLMRSDANGVTFLDGTAGDGQGFILFKNTTGINLGTALTVAIGSTGLAAGTDIILHNSGFSGATDLIAAADEAKAKMIAGTGVLADEQVGLAIDFDHTA